MLSQLELGPIPESLLLEPLDYIYADHFRQRAVCVKLEQLIEDPDDPCARHEAAEILAFMEQDLPLHIADEEDSLFPLLRLRCQPEDDIEQVLQILSEEHASDEALAKDLIAELRRLSTARGRAGGRALKWVALAYIQTQRRHLSWENALLLAIARRRLMPADLVSLGRDMAQRRGVSYPKPAS